MNAIVGPSPRSFLHRMDLWLRCRGALVVVVVLAVSGLALRVWGIAFGLPYRYHIDETFYVAGALKMASNGFQLPIITHGPNLFYMVLLGEYGVLYAVLRLVGVMSSVASFEGFYRTDPTAFVLLARLTSAISGILTLIPTYFIGKRLRGPTLGLAGAALLTFCFQHVRESHYGTPDVFVGLLVALCLWRCLVMLETGRGRDYAIAGIVGGLATGTKFTNILLALLLGVAHVVIAWREASGEPRGFVRKLLTSRLLLMALSFCAGFALAYPNVVLRPAVFWEYVQFLASVGEAGFIEFFRIEPSPAWRYYASSLSWGLGWLMLAAAVLGLLWVALRREAGGALLLGFIVIYILFLIRAPYYASRYLVPLLPILCTLAAAAILEIANVRALIGCGRGIEAVLLLATLVQPLAFSVRHDVLLRKVDTRTIAKSWIEANISAGTKIAVDWQKHAPPLRTLSDEFPTDDAQYDVVVADGIGLPRYSLADYREIGVEYLVLSSFIDDQVLVSPSDVEARDKLHQGLASEGELVYEARPYSGDRAPGFLFDQIFGPVSSLWRLDRPGPTLKVYYIGHDR